MPDDQQLKAEQDRMDADRLLLGMKTMRAQLVAFTGIPVALRLVTGICAFVGWTASAR